MKPLVSLAALAVVTSFLALPSVLPSAHAAAPAAVTRDDADEDGDSLVSLALAFDHAVATPGAKVTLAVRATMKPRWHVYWGPNPGDSGLPFTAEVTAPAGWKVGPAQFPWPKRHVDEGDIVQYVHEGELVVLYDVEIPADAKPGAAAFEVAARWLACTSVCLPGTGKVAGSLTVGAEAKPADAALFTAARARLPRPWSELARVQVAPSGDGAMRKVAIVVPGAKQVEFFPYKSETSHLRARTIDVGKQGSTARLEFELETVEGSTPRTAAGVLWVKTDTGETSYAWSHTFQP